MQPSTGKIHHFDTAEELRKLEAEAGEEFVPIPDDQLKAVQGMNRHERRKWAATEQARLRAEARGLQRRARRK